MMDHATGNISDTIVDTPSSSAPETARDLFSALVRLHETGEVALAYDYKRLHHMDCPVVSEADSNIWAYAVLALTLLAFWRGGWQWAAGVAVVGTILYYTLGQMYVRRRIRNRVTERALASLELWQKLWRFGGISLVPRSGGEVCAAPDGNWMALVRRFSSTRTSVP